MDVSNSCLGFVGSNANTNQTNQEKERKAFKMNFDKKLNTIKVSKKKIKISKDKHETKITLFNVHIENIDLWDVENKSISVMLTSDNGSQDKSASRSLIRRSTSRDGFVIPVVNMEVP